MKIMASEAVMLTPANRTSFTSLLRLRKAGRSASTLCMKSDVPALWVSFD